MKTLARIAFVALAVVGGAKAAAADPIVYDGGAPNQYTIYFADQSDPYTADAESFVLQPGQTTVTDAHWWGGCLSAECSPGDFTISFYNDNAGAIGSLIQSYSVGNANPIATGLLIDFVPEYSYDVTFAPLVLSAGIPYWFAISNSTAGLAWGQETTGGAGGHWQYVTGTGWTAQPDDLAFYLTGTSAVPEPATLALLGIGGIVATLRRRRRRAYRGK